MSKDKSKFQFYVGIITMILAVVLGIVMNNAIIPLMMSSGFSIFMFVTSNSKHIDTEE